MAASLSRGCRTQLDGSSGRAKVTRAGRVVSFAFTRGRARDSGTYEVRGNGLPAGSLGRCVPGWRDRPPVCGRHHGARRVGGVDARGR